MTDERDNAGVIAPPPLIYLVPLVLGLLLKRTFPIPFLPPRATRVLGWPLIVGGVSLMSWFFFTMRRADTPIDPREPVSNLATDGPLHPQPRLPLDSHDLRGGIQPRQRALLHTAPVGGAVGHTARCDRTRGTLPGAQVRRGVLYITRKSILTLGVSYGGRSGRSPLR